MRIPRSVRFPDWLLLGAAFALRVWGLDRPSLWYDEAFSVVLARGAVWQPLEAHPPLFYLILRLWMGLAGSTAFAVRFPSVMAGTLTVAVLGAMAARLSGSRTAGRIAWGLGATLPFWIWESREARMYALLGMWTALSLWGLVRRCPVGATMAALAGVYTHYAMLWMLPGLLALLARQGPVGRRGALGLALAAIPGALHAWWVGRTQGAFWAGRLDLVRALIDLGKAQGLQAPMAGYLLPEGLPWAPGMIAGAVVATAGLLHGGRRPEVRRLLLLTGLLPLAIGLGLLYFNPKFHPHYFIAATIPIWLAVSVGSGDGFRRGRLFPGVVGMLAWALMVGPPLTGILGRPERVKDDWRGAVAAVEARRGPREAVVLVSGFALPAYQVYARSTAPLPLPADPVVDVRHVLDYEAAAPILNAHLAGHAGAWLVQWGDEINDPAQVVAAALDWIGDEIETLTFAGGIRVRHFIWEAFRPLPSDPAALFGHPGQPLGSHLIWLGYGLPGGRRSIDQPLPVIAGWRIMGPLPSGLRASLRLEWADGTLWGQWDGALGGETWDTARWPWPRTLLTRYTVQAQVGAPPGRYVLRLVVYGAGKVWLDARLGPVDLGPPQRPYRDPRWEKPPLARWPGLALTHIDVEGEPRACQPLSLALWWRVDGNPEATWVRLEIDGEVTAGPWNPAQPDARWGPGERWRGRYRVRMPCAPGRYPLRVGLGDGEAPPVLEIAVGP